MAGQGSLATTAIITKGLTCGHGPLDPCKSGLITTAFSLYCTSTPPTLPPSGGGGPYPHDAWNKFNPGEIQNFYKPVDPTDYLLIPKDQEAEYFRRYAPVKITFKMGDILVEKEYRVPEERRKVVIKAFSMVDVTRDRINIAITNMKRVTKGIVLTVRNFRLRNK